MLSEAGPSPQGLWQSFLHAVEQKLSAHVLQTWLRPVHCTSFDGQNVVLEVRDQFFRDWLADHYLDFVRDTLAELLRHPVKVSLVVNQGLPGAERPMVANLPVPAPVEPAPAKAAAPAKKRTKKKASKPVEASEDVLSQMVGEDRPLNERYNFDSFVQGPSNQFAFAACHAAAQNPGRSYNPLFIYGGVGLGKTHLLSAIGHHILDQRKDAQIIYTSSEQFTNEVINAVLTSRLEEFRNKYRSHGDVILMDDIQLIAGKERTQHEFFHIFNTLYDSHRQIVVTSDKLPHEIPDIEERLRNRFQWGLIADVQPPEIETRIAILRKKASVENFELSNEVAFFLARSIRSNVRELEGALVRIMAHASLTSTPLTIDYVRSSLGDILQHSLSEVSAESIQKVVAQYFGLRVSDLKGARRQKELVRARQIGMFLCRKHLGSSYPEIGARFGNKDHTTAMSACSRIAQVLATDAGLRAQLDEIEQRIDNSGQS